MVPTLVKTGVSSCVNRWYSLLGLIFIVRVIVMPHGLVPGFAQVWERRATARRARAAPVQA